jgi:hypothetical protein
MAQPRFQPVQGRQGGPPPPAKKQGSIPVFPIVLLVIYIIYVGVMIIGPIYVDSLRSNIDNILDFNTRVAIGGVLLALFIVILGYTLYDSGRSQSPPARPPPRPGPAPQGAVSKFKPVQPAKPAPEPAKVAPTTQVSAPPNKEGSTAKPKEVEKPGTPKQTIISYPNEVEGGFYGATMIDISKTKVLKLRSMVVEPEYLRS